MTRIISFFSLAIVLAQAAMAQDFASGFTPEERSRLQREEKVDNRIKVYEKASKRLQNLVSEAVASQQFNDVPATLSTWMEIITASLKDIEANLKGKKKSKQLIKYEIQIRKAITAVEDYKLRAPLDQQECFDAWIEKADAVHTRFVDILFKR